MSNNLNSNGEFFHSTPENNLIDIFHNTSFGDASTEIEDIRTLPNAFNAPNAPFPIETSKVSVREMINRYNRATAAAEKFPVVHLNKRLHTNTPTYGSHTNLQTFHIDDEFSGVLNSRLSRCNSSILNITKSNNDSTISSNVSSNSNVDSSPTATRSNCENINAPGYCQINSKEDISDQSSFQSRTTISKTEHGVRITIDIYFDKSSEVNVNEFVGRRIETDLPPSRLLQELQERSKSLRHSTIDEQAEEQLDSSADDHTSQV